MTEPLLVARNAQKLAAVLKDRAAGGGILGELSAAIFGSTGPRGGRHEGMAESMAKSAVRSMGSAVGREIIRGVLGGIMGSKSR